MYFRSLSTLGFLKSEPKAYYNFVVLILKNRLRHLPFHVILTENSALSNKKKICSRRTQVAYGANSTTMK